MTKELKHWPNHSFLDALRPPAGRKVRYALFATYSADLWSMGAALLALADRDPADGEGSRADMAEALDALSERSAFIIQRGRLAKPSGAKKVAAIFDKFITEIPYDEEEHGCWHPKIALVCYESNEDKDDVIWRLWLGSRNLTRAMNVDFGLVLDGFPATQPHKGAAPVDGVADLGRYLAEQASLTIAPSRSVERDLKQVVWIMPPRMKVKSVRLKLPSDTSLFPVSPESALDVVVISPFLDARFISGIGQWGDGKTKRWLLTTDSAVRKLACNDRQSLAGFGERVHVYARPTPDPSDVGPADGQGTPVVEAALAEGEEQSRGLHAKILAVRAGRRLTLWVGSANATQRGWSVGNAEVIAEIECDTSVADGLFAMVLSGRPVNVDELVAEGEPEEDELARQLEDCRQHLIGTLRARLARNGDQFVMMAERPPEIVAPNVTLRVGLVTGDPVLWPPSASSVSLGSAPLAEQTRLVRLRLNNGPLVCEWLQKFDVQPPLPPERDRAAIAAHLRASEIMAWMQAVLTGTNAMADPEAPGWDTPETGDEVPATPGRRTTRPIPPPPMTQVTLDDILSCWSRDPAGFGALSQRANTYLDAVLTYGNPTPDEHAELSALKRCWKKAATTLGVR